MGAVDAITLGESLGLVMGEPATPLRAGSSVRFSFAGAESNVAIGLARLGHTVGFVSRVGDDFVGRMVTETLRSEGVDVSGVVVDGTAPTALMVRQHRTADALTVLYYRDGAAGSRLQPDDVPDLSGARLLHVTGITPALSASALTTVETAVRAARAAGLVVSLDVNHRALLWTAQEAGAALAPLLDAVDLVFGGTTSSSRSPSATSATSRRRSTTCCGSARRSSCASAGRTAPPSTARSAPSSDPPSR